MTKTNGPTAEDEILLRLDVIVKLLLRNSCRDDASSITDQIKTLHSMGLKNAQIARLVGKASNYVSSILSQGGRRNGK